MSNKPVDPSATPQNGELAKPKPITQNTGRNYRSKWPDWAKQLPYFRLPKPDESFQLIDPVKLDFVLRSADPAAVQRIKEDMKFLEHELLRLFRQQDIEAALQQNRYRLYQVGFIFLATLATVAGSFQALLLSSVPWAVPWIAFAETVVALIATYLATISGREPPFPKWMNSRRRAETLRREYFRFVANLPPYDKLEGYHRRMMLSARAAQINRGVFPDETTATP